MQSRSLAQAGDSTGNGGDSIYTVRQVRSESASGYLEQMFLVIQGLLLLVSEFGE